MKSRRKGGRGKYLRRSLVGQLLVLWRRDERRRRWAARHALEVSDGV